MNLPSPLSRTHASPTAAPDELKRRLEYLYHTFPYAERLKVDPLAFVLREKTPDDQAVVGLLASGLAYGRVDLFRPAIAAVVARMHASGGPDAFVRQFEPQQQQAFLDGFRYRMTSGRTLGQLFFALRGLLEAHGSLEAAFRAGFSPAHEDIGPALSQFVQSLYARIPGGPDRSLRHLLPDPALGSACKRLNLFLRWMVRRQEGVDPGPWRSLPASHLLLPLDTHTLRMSFNLGLIERPVQRWATAQEVTRRLRALDPQDPVKYDFALCHLGMAGDCPSRLQVEICDRCALSGLCRWWHP